MQSDSIAIKDKRTGNSLRERFMIQIPFADYEGLIAIELRSAVANDLTKFAIIVAASQHPLDF